MQEDELTAPSELEGPHTVSDHSITQRQYAIFERAVKKWKDDLGLWIEYINVLRRNGARTKVAGVCARCVCSPCLLHYPF